MPWHHRRSAATLIREGMRLRGLVAMLQKWCPSPTDAPHQDMGQMIWPVGDPYGQVKTGYSMGGSARPVPICSRYEWRRRHAMTPCFRHTISSQHMQAKRQWCPRNQKPLKKTHRNFVAMPCLLHPKLHMQPNYQNLYLVASSSWLSMTDLADILVVNEALSMT